MIFKNQLVIEFASVLAGPTVGMFMAELGARVIKIESPHGGDVTRSWKLATEDRANDRPAYFCCANWGKESIALDLSAPADREAAFRLIDRADFVLTSFRTGAARRLGLDGESLTASRPELIVGEINGYGPDTDLPAYDAIIQAETGFSFLNGNNGLPAKMPVALMDLMAAHQLKQGLLVAYIQKVQSGKGSVVKASLLESGLSALANQATNWLTAGFDPQPMGSEHPNIVPYGSLFPALDGRPVLLAVGSDSQFVALCGVLGEVPPPEFATNLQRVHQREAVKSWLAPRMARFPSTDLLTRLAAAGVPAGAVNPVSVALAHPLTTRILHRDGDLAALHTLVAHSDSREKPALSPPPHLNAHSDALRREFGL